MRKKEEEVIIPSKDIIIGNAKAKVTIIQFVDYESEKCAKAHTITKELMKEFGKDINFNFRHFPMTMVHQNSHKAAEAAIAAGQEGKLFELHELLLQNRRHLGTVSLKNYAREVGVENKGLLNDLINGKYGWFVQDDLKFGMDNGVKEPPAFMINGKLYKGKLTTKALSEEITKVLKKIKSKQMA